MPHFTLRLPADLIEKIEAVAEARGVSRSDFAREALERAITPNEAEIQHDDAAPRVNNG